MDEENSEVAEIGYMIKAEHWGKGYGSEIAKVLIEKARKSTLKTLKAIIDPNNMLLGKF